ncbi:MAG: sugar phosphate isomerase/epimerase [Firmicutes bacterium]|nr:sugar phosphate isomerase/epimerase [Bacillota bacterium]
MNNPIIMHINYCEQGQTLREVFEVASSIGFDGVEFRRYKDGYADGQRAYLEAIAALKEEFNLPLTLFGGPELVTSGDDKAAREQSLEEYLQFLQIADELQLLSTVNLMVCRQENPLIPVDLFHCDAHGYAALSEEDWDRSILICQRIADLYPHVRFAFETHMFYAHDTAKSARLLVDAIDQPNFGINLDYGNSIFFKKTEPLAEAIEIAGKKLFYTHLKSYQPYGHQPGELLPTSLADGCINHRQYIRYLHEAGFEGPIGIEAPRPGDRQHFAAEDFAYIQPIIRKLQDAE